MVIVPGGCCGSAANRDDGKDMTLAMRLEPSQKARKKGVGGEVLESIPSSQCDAPRPEHWQVAGGRALRVTPDLRRSKGGVAVSLGESLVCIVPKTQRLDALHWYHALA